MKKRLLVATLVAIGPLLALAQNVITGRVIDAKTGEPLIGASVIVKTDRQGVATDADGNYHLLYKYYSDSPFPDGEYWFSARPLYKEDDYNNWAPFDFHFIFNKG